MDPKPMTRPERFVRSAIDCGALGLFPDGLELKSKRVSPYFFNIGKFEKGYMITGLATAYATVVDGLRADVLFGLAYKGIPLATMTAMALNNEIGFAFNRKEEKDHGEGGTLVGTSLKGKRVVIIDDVMTTGSSSRKAVEIIRAHGGTPVACVIAFDRQERMDEINISAVQDFQFTLGIPVRSIAKLDDLVSFLQKTTNETYELSISREKILEKIFAYRKQYGALTQ